MAERAVALSPREPLRAHRGPATFRERDVKAAIRAARAAGEETFSIEIAKDGRIRVIVPPKSAEPVSIGGRNPWDEGDAG